MYGQMLNGRISEHAEYIQFDICGLNVKEVLKKFFKSSCSLPLVLHGDWEKNTTPNSILTEKRLMEYAEIVQELSKHINILAITLHPPTRLVTLNEFMAIITKLRNKVDVPVLLENRSNKKYLLSHPDEIACLLDHGFNVTIDVPQLYIFTSKNNLDFERTLLSISLNENIFELHLANVELIRGRFYVGRSIPEGLIDYAKLKPIFQRPKLKTLEVLGGVTAYQKSYNYLREII